jgi:membrane protease subunit (stomatin/prohibitin family)
MSFFDKMKQGASEAAKKAQQTVETTKLRVQISSKEKELEKAYKQIGEAVYQAYTSGNWKQAEVVTYCEHIGILYQDIQSIEMKIKHAKQVKECRCGTMVASNVKFCPGCGFAFPDTHQEEAAAAEVYPICHVCRTPNEAAAKFCSHCGIAM